MKTKNTLTAFEDTPLPDRLETAIRTWKIPELPESLRTASHPHEASTLMQFPSIRQKLARTRNIRRKSRLEVFAINWLYELIRLNVKRGRVFDLRQVFRERVADCLGYAKLFTLLGRLMGLDAGVVEIVVDNRGRLVPHTAALVKLANGRLRFIDLWYGSKNIRHKKTGLNVKQGDAWRVTDLKIGELGHYEVSYLPDRCVDGITRYVLGNRALNRKDYKDAIQHYSKALRLYPGNARVHYNRAVAYENLDNTEKAYADYALAVRDEDSIIRISATEHDEITALIELDEKGIDERDQQIYLLAKGFITGRKLGAAAVAKKFGISEEEVIRVLDSNR